MRFASTLVLLLKLVVRSPLWGCELQEGLPEGVMCLMTHGKSSTSCSSSHCLGPVHMRAFQAALPALRQMSQHRTTVGMALSLSRACHGCFIGFIPLPQQLQPPASGAALPVQPGCLALIA